MATNDIRKNLTKALRENPFEALVFRPNFPIYQGAGPRWQKDVIETHRRHRP